MLIERINKIDYLHWLWRLQNAVESMFLPLNLSWTLYLSFPQQNLVDVSLITSKLHQERPGGFCLVFGGMIALKEVSCYAGETSWRQPMNSPSWASNACPALPSCEKAILDLQPSCLSYDWHLIWQLNSYILTIKDNFKKICTRFEQTLHRKF